jgi:O-succinylbenzoate synthase
MTDTVGTRSDAIEPIVIDAIDVYHVGHPLREAWTTAYGSDAVAHSVLIRATSRDQEAWAEACPLERPTYSPEYAAGVFELITRVMAPVVIGQELASAQQVLALLGPFKGNRFAKAALEIAWWQLHSALTGTPLYRLLGGVGRAVAAGEALGVETSIDHLLALIQASVDSGYQRIKLKVRPDRDLLVLQEVCRTFPNVGFHIDGNCGYSLEDWPLFAQLDELGLVMIEQPLGYGDIVEHAELQKRMQTPICLDESCTSVEAARAAISLGACRVINIKPARVGGLTDSLAIAALCDESGLECWVGSMLESSIGGAANLALASIASIRLPSDIFPSQRFYDEEITERELVLSGPGTMRPLEVPASDLRPIPTRLAERTLAHARVSFGSTRARLA